MNKQYASWRKSSYSNSEGGACVEVALDGCDVGVRDTKDRALGHINVPAASWRALLTQVS